MKTKYLIAAFSFLAAVSCTPESSQFYNFEYTVDKVVCQANSNYFVADGISQLGLEVKLYAKQGTYTDVNGREQIRYMEIPRERWREHTIKFFDRAGKEVQPSMTSTTMAPGEYEFYAEVDGMRSSKPVLQLRAEHPETGEPIAEQPEPVFFTMNVRAAKPIPAKKRIPVIFHIVDMELPRNTEQIIDPDAVYYVIDQWNKVFGRKLSTASNGANTNLEFVPAVRDPRGNILAEPGINRVYTADGNIARADIWTNTNLYWDYDRYLQVYIMSHSSWNPVYAADQYRRTLPCAFAGDSYDAQALPLPASVTMKSGLDAAALAAWKAKPDYLENVALVFHKTKQPFANLTTDYVSQMAGFLGVIPNMGASETSYHFGTPKVYTDDYCDDTFMFNAYYTNNGWGNLENRDYGSLTVKYTVTLNAAKNAGVPGYPWIIYESANANEADSYQTVVTQDQARRIEWTLNNAVARQAWKDDYAIKPVE